MTIRIGDGEQMRRRLCFGRASVRTVYEGVVWRLLVCLSAVLWVVWSSSAALANDGGRAALVAVEYMPSGGKSQPLVTPRVEELGRSMERLWSGRVWDAQQTTEEARRTWTLRPSREVLGRIEETVPKAQERFLLEGPETSINALESLLKDADEMLPSIASSPAHATMLLNAHLLLWQGLAAEDPKQARLGAVMVAAARRFPTAVVDTQQWPPDVVEAFSVAQQTLVEQGASLTFDMRQVSGDGCRLFVNGLDYGDGRGGGVAVARGAAYHVGVCCGQLGAMSPPRRVVTEGHQTVALDVDLTQRLLVTSAGVALSLPQGPESVADAARFASALGRALKVSDVVLAGVFEDPNGRRILQLDRINVVTEARTCSVRLLVDDASAWDIDKSVHALHLQKPTASAPVSFASQDNIYRSVDEYVEWVGDEGSYPLTWTFSTLATSVLVGGGVAAWMTSGKEDELAKCIANSACRASNEIHALRGDAEDLSSLRTGLFVGGGVLALGALGFYFLERPSNKNVLAPDPPPRAGDLRLSPAVGAEGVSFELMVLFD